MNTQTYRLAVILTGCTTLAATAIVDAPNKMTAKQLVAAFYGAHLVRIARVTLSK